jgi:glutathione synthase/RimK-type ligase-like ATP-grasp enzyme
LPCVLKQPDSAFSLGVVKVENEQELADQTTRLFKNSELLVAQRFVPTDYDWRLGVFNDEPLYACRYHRAPSHWQIVKRDRTGDREFGKVESIPLDLVPANVLRYGVRAARLFGDGLYGVDLKQAGKECYVIEVNDNPNLDAGLEDGVLKDELYERIMRGFLARVQARESKARKQ